MGLSRRTRLLSLVLITVVLTGVVVDVIDATQEQPNMVVVSVDSLRADRLGVYGAERGVTPNLDRFAEDATVFQEAVAQDTWTLPTNREA